MKMLIDGEWVDADDGGVDEIRDKATGELIETAPRATVADVSDLLPRTRRQLSAKGLHQADPGSKEPGFLFTRLLSNR